MADLILKNATNASEVFSQLAKDEKNNPVKTINNFVTIFETDVNLRDCVRFNEISNAPENIRALRNWEDADSSAAKCYIEQVYHIRNKECFEDAFNIICNRNHYNPIKEIIESTVWDKKTRISTILQKYLKCEDSAYTSEVARLLFLGGIKRLYEPGCKFDYMIIFRGKQGNGKSTFVRWLAINDDFYKEVTQIDGQVGKEALDKVWIGEMSELLALTKTKDVEMVKSFITRQNDSFRRPYARFTTDNYRKCILIGTTNKSQFLTDKTGNRRFLSIMTNSNGYELYSTEKQCRAEILQCWAEAKYYYDSKNYTIVADPLILSEIEKQQAAVIEDDWRVGVIEKYLETQNRVCVKLIWDNAISKDGRECTKKDSSDIVSIMDNFDDWERVSSLRFNEYGIQRGWKKITKLDDLEPLDDDGQIPF